MCQCRSIVRTVTHHSHQLTGSLFFLNVIHLVFRFGFSNKVVHTGLLGNIFGGQRVVTGYHYRLHTHLTQTLETFFDTRFDNILQFDDTGNLLVDTNHQRSTTVCRNGLDNILRILRELVTGLHGDTTDSVESTLADFSTVFQVDTGTLRLSRKLNHVCTFGVQGTHTYTHFTSQFND